MAVGSAVNGSIDPVRTIRAGLGELGREEADGSAAAAAAPAADDVASGAERACDARRARVGLQQPRRDPPTFICVSRGGCASI